MRAPRIKVMPEWLRNQIAAGEVVERPASVLKELLENALDAGATRVVVEVEEGGRKRLRVVDDGCGMSREEAALALERHATSKCMSIDDLRHIATFGFRGEALPSIASVSRFTLKTRPADDSVGTRVRIVEGGERQVDDVAMAPGTEVLVEDLFYNVPARRKFLRKDATETRNIVEVVQRMALSHHDVHFELQVDGRRSLSAPPEPEQMARIHAILGRKVCMHLYECFLDGRISVSGFITRPDVKKRGTSGLFTFVNGRFVRDRLITQAVANGYSTLLGKGEYPYAVLDVKVPPNEVDVNVHPAKSEVRFERGNEVFAAVSRAVRLTLSQAPWVANELATQDSAAGLQPEGGPRSGEWRKVPPLADASCPPEGGSRPGESRLSPPLEGGRGAAAGGGQPPEVLGAEAPPTDFQRPSPTSSLSFSKGLYANMRYLGQFANCFLLGQAGTTLAVVDQHAAHERILFERLVQQFTDSAVPTRRLLVPQLLELDAAQVAAVESLGETLERLGFHLEPFGGGTVAVKAVPALLKERSAEPAVRSVLDSLEGQEGEVTLATLFHKPISTMACHAAVRAGDPMDREEVLALFAQMDGIDLAAWCPHGRPVVTFFSHNEVARWFHRT